MDINVDIKPEDINKYVVQAIIDSSIGDQVKKIVEEKVRGLSSSWNNPIQGVVDSEVRTILQKIITQEYREKLDQMVRDHITDDVVEDIILKAWESFRDQ